MLVVIYCVLMSLETTCALMYACFGFSYTYKLYVCTMACDVNSFHMSADKKDLYSVIPYLVQSVT